MGSYDNSPNLSDFEEDVSELEGSYEESNSKDETHSQGTTEDEPEEDKTEIAWDNRRVLLWFDSGSHSKTDVPAVLVKVLEDGNDNISQLDEPEIALSEHRLKAKALVMNKRFEEALVEKIRCVAWARLGYGDCHWQMARSYAELAEAYLKLRKLPVQAVKHATTGRDILLNKAGNKIQGCGSSDEDHFFSLLTLELVYFVLGAGNAGLRKYDLADNFLNKSLLVSRKKETEFGLSVGDVVRRLETLTYLGKVCKVKGKLGLTLEHFEKAIDLATEKLGQHSSQLIQLYILSGKTELAFSKSATPDRAIELISNAKDIAAKTAGKTSTEYAKCCEMLYHANHSYDDDLYHEHAESCILEAIKIYTEHHKSKHLKILHAFELLCQFYISKGRLHDAEEVLHKILEGKVARYGDPSEQVGDAYKTVGGLYLSQGKVKQGAEYMILAKQCYEGVLGKQHKKSKNIGKLLADIGKLPVAKELTIPGKTLEDRPLFCTTVASKSQAYSKPISF